MAKARTETKENMMTKATEKHIKINITRLGGPMKNGEGVWATFLSDEDEKIYADESKKGKPFKVVLCNHPVTTNELKWGDTVVVINNGSERPYTKTPVIPAKGIMHKIWKGELFDA